jgi:hypothetical protein
LLNVNGISDALTHSDALAVTVTATNASTANVIMALQNARCIRPGIGKILKDKLVLAQALVNGKRKQLAIDTYAAMVREVQILAAKRLIPGFARSVM